MEKTLGQEGQEQAEKPSLQDLVAKHIESSAETKPESSDEAKTESTESNEEVDDDDSSGDDVLAGDDVDSDESATEEPVVEKPITLTPVGEFIRDEFIRLGYDESEVKSLDEDRLKSEWRRLEELKSKAEKANSASAGDDTDEVDDQPEPQVQNTAPEKKEESPSGIQPLKLNKEDERLIDWEMVDGVSVAIPKAKSGNKGKAAADRANEWAEQWRLRQRVMTEDPMSLLAPDVQKIVDAKIAEALKKHNEEQAKRQHELSRASAEVAESQQIREFWAKNSTELFACDANGVPRKSLVDQQEIVSERGKQFEKILFSIAEGSTAPRSVLLNKAMSILNELSPKKEPAKPATKDEKRRKFLDNGRKNKATQLVASNPPAREDEKQRVGGKKSMAELMLSRPELADNKFVAKLATLVS